MPETDWLYRFAFSPSGSAADAVEEPEAPETDAEPTDEAEPDNEPEETPEPEATETPEPEPVDFSTYGLSNDPKELSQQILTLRQQAAEARRYQEYAFALQQQQQQAQAAQMRQQQQAQQGNWAPGWGKPPENFDPSRLPHLTPDDLANNLALKDAYEKYTEWHRKGVNQLLSDPVNALFPGFQPKIEQQVNQIVEQRLRQQQQQWELKQFANENRDWIYEQDGRTLSQAGRMWDSYYMQALQFGHPDPIQYAESFVNSAAYQMRLQEEANRQPAGEAAPTDADKKASFLRHSAAAAARQPNRSGTVPRKTRKTPPQNPKKDVWQELREQLRGLPENDFET